MIQLAFMMVCLFSSTFAQSGEVLGSRVITDSSGRVGPMLFKSSFPNTMSLQKTPNSKWKVLKIVNGSCTMGGRIVGGPCEVKKDFTLITFNEVPNYHLLMIGSKTEIYTIYFAKDCKFP
ncbi:unnamed protein product, partial [Hymenolepis diminuta]